MTAGWSKIVYDGIQQFMAEDNALRPRPGSRSRGDSAIMMCRLDDVDCCWRVRAHAGPRSAAGLRLLSNGGLPVSSDGWERFITSPHLANLEVLVGRRVDITDDDMLVFNCANTSLEPGRTRPLPATDRNGRPGASAVVRSPCSAETAAWFGLAYNDIVEDRATRAGLQRIGDGSHLRASPDSTATRRRARAIVTAPGRVTPDWRYTLWQTK